MTRRTARFKVFHVRKLRAQRTIGRLRLRELPLSGLLGDLSVIHETLAPRVRLPEIYHERTAELVYCLQGIVTGVFNGRRFRLRPGNFVLLPPGARHRFKAGAAGCEALSIFYPALKLGANMDVRSSA